MINLLLNHRYYITAEIGRGGMGIVYRALDTLLEREVAVKVLSTHTLGSQGRTRLLREAQAAARLNHPNIISIFDAGDADGMSYIVMELLDGDSLFEKKPDTIQATLEVICQVCEALEHAHSNGIIHRDLKPENVILTSKGIAKLTDFGLSRSISARVSIDGGIVGTVYYLAPEQALRQDVDSRADLYALGAMMFELLAGRLPFIADDPLGVISQHLNAPVVPPSTYNPAIPPVLDTLVVRLLSKKPEDRPASAAEVLKILQQVLENPSLAEIPEELDLCTTGEFSPINRLALGRLVGRKRELSEIKALWREILARGPGNPEISRSILLIDGETGVGKTPLLKEVRTLAELSGSRILQGDCFARTSAPYAPITQVLRILQPFPTDLPVSVLVEALSQAPVPESQQSGYIVRAPYKPPVNPQIEQQRIFDHVYQLFEEVASQQPLLLIIEDLQWADAGTLLMLHHLARRSRTSALKLLIVATYRPSELSINPALHSFLLDLNQERLSLSIDLEPFTRDQTRDLLATMFMNEISEEFLDAIFGVTEGNLFFIEEICKTLIEEGRLTCSGSGWQFKGMEELELPQSVRMALQMRISRLPDEAQDVLRLASMIGREFDYEVLSNASDLDEDALIDAIEQAEKAQLITEMHRPFNSSGDGEAFCFAHTLIPATLRQDISSLRRRRIHRRLASTYEQLRPDDYESLAFHYSQAGEIEKARFYNLRAGERARKLYANEDAVCFFTEALRLTPDHDPQRFQALAAREQVYDLLANREMQRTDIDAMLDLADYADDDTLHCDALLALAHFYLDTEYLQAREPALQAVELARQIKDPLREARGLRCLGWGAWLGSDNHESLSALEQAVIRFRQAGLLSDAAECLHMLSVVTGLQGLGELSISQRYAEDAIRLSKQSGDRRQEAISVRRLAIAYMDQHKYPETLQTAMQALALHQEMKDRSEEASALNVIGLTLAYLERTGEGLEYIRRSLQMALETGFTFGISLALENIHWLHYLAEGNLEGGLAFMDENLSQAEIRTNPFLVRTIRLRKAEVLSQLGQYEASLAVTDEAEKSPSPPLTTLVMARILWMRAYNWAGIADFQQARAAISALRDLSRKFERPTEAASFLRLQAFTAWLENDPARQEEAAAHAAQSILLLRGTGWTYDLADNLLVSARLALAHGKPEMALEHTSEALQHLAHFPLLNEGLLFTHSRALRAKGQTEEANQYLERAYRRVMLVSARLKNAAFRQSWLTRVRDNVDILSDQQQYLSPL